MVSNSNGTWFEVLTDARKKAINLNDSWKEFIKLNDQKSLVDSYLFTSREHACNMVNRTAILIMYIDKKLKKYSWKS